MTEIGVDKLINDKEYASVACAFLAVCATYETPVRRTFLTALLGDESGHSIATFIKTIPVPDMAYIVVNYHRSLLGVFVAASVPNADLDLLDDMAQSPNKYLRMVVGSNPVTSVETLEHLSKDSNDAVRYAVLMNPSTPDVLLATMPPWAPGSLISQVAIHSAHIGLI